MLKRIRIDWLLLPIVGAVLVVGLWGLASATVAKELP